MTITGKIIEIGDLKHLWDSPERTTSGIVILVTKDQIKEMKENLLYATVRVELVKE